MFWVQIDQRSAHTFCMVDVIAKHDCFGQWIGTLEIVRYGLSNQFGSLINHHRSVEVFLVVDPIFDHFTFLIDLAFRRTPAL